MWSYNPSTSTLTCRYQSPGASSLDFPDNVTAAPKTGRIFVCEDGGGDNYVRMLGPRARMYDVVLNRLTSNATGAPRFGEEFAGATFSPDGATMFINIQANLALSFAIWGPWHALDTEG